MRAIPVAPRPEAWSELERSAERLSREMDRLKTAMAAYDAVGLAAFRPEDDLPAHVTGKLLDATGARGVAAGPWRGLMRAEDAARVEEAAGEGGAPGVVPVRVRTSDGRLLPADVHVTKDGDDAHAVLALGRDDAPPEPPLVARWLLRAVVEATRAEPAQLELAGERLAARFAASDPAAIVRAAEAAGLGRFRYEAPVPRRHVFRARTLVEERDGARAPTCSVALGFLRASLAAGARARVLGVELSCRSRGDAEHVFVLGLQGAQVAAR